ncbi:hypothetical protein N7470_005402 [Penicillium chermesinum]|nr:hypothetical protein N7470_005402 [Penicillium chermesinum]
MAIKSVAVIGAGPAGVIAVDALVKEQAFDVIRVFERQEKAGGCWVSRDDEPPRELDLDRLADRTADAPVAIPASLPCRTPPLTQQRFTDSPIYPGLETNVDASAMSFSQESIPVVRSEWSIQRHGEDTPFRPHAVIRQYVEDVLTVNGNQHLVEYNTTVERAIKNPETEKWDVVLRRRELHDGAPSDYWWSETFDAIMVASGHYAVPYIPAIKGLKELAMRNPGSVEHTKHYRGPEKYRGKKVVTVGASVSAADTAISVTSTARSPVIAVVRGRYNPFFGDEAFKNPNIQRRPPISHITERTVHFEDGTSESDVDHIIFGTGFTWQLPFLPQIPTRNNRVPDIFLHVFHREPTLMFIGAVGAGLTFKIFEWQAFLLARLLFLPWPNERSGKRRGSSSGGDGPSFSVVSPHFESYFERLRAIAGPPRDGKGRPLPAFDENWVIAFNSGHERRKRMWRRLNRGAQL